MTLKSTNLIYEKVPPLFLRKLSDLIASRGLKDAVQIFKSGIERRWVDSSALDSPQRRLGGSHYPSDNLTVLQAYDPRTAMHEITHEFARRFAEGWRQVRYEDMNVQEAVAYLAQAALFGDWENARNGLTSNHYGVEAGEFFEKFQRIYWMYGDGFLRRIFTNLGIVDGKAVPKYDLQELFDSKQSLDAALHNIGWNSGNLRKDVAPHDYLRGHFHLTDPIAESVTRDGIYDNLEDAVMDLSPSKTDRISAFHKLTSVFLFYGDMGIQEARLSAERLVLTDQYQLALQAFDDIGGLLTSLSEVTHGSSSGQAVMNFTQAVATNPVAAYEARANLAAYRNMIGSFTSSRRLASCTFEKFTNDTRFQRFIMSLGGGKILGDYAQGAGTVFAGSVLEHLLGFRFDFPMHVDFNQWVANYTNLNRHISGNVDIGDQAEVLSFLPKALAAGIVATFFEGGRPQDYYDVQLDQNSPWCRYTERLAQEFWDVKVGGRELAVPAFKTRTYGTNQIFAEGPLFNSPTFLFINFYKASVEAESKSKGYGQTQIKWQDKMGEIVNRFYDVTKNFAEELAQEHARYSR